MIRGRKRPMNKAPEVKADLKCNIHNRFDIEVVDAATGEVKQRAQAENVICNALWTRLFAPNTYNNYIHYGTGAGTPAVTDTSLFTYLGYGTPATSDDVYSSDNASGIISFRRKIQLSENTAVGATLTEVGIAYGTSAGNLVTHAMLKDMNGNQISIAKTSTEIINIYATVFLHWAVGGFDGGFIVPLDITQTISTATYPSLFSWLLGVTASMNSSYAKMSWFVGENVFYNPASSAAFNVNLNSSAKTVAITLPRLGVSTANIGGIKAIAVQSTIDKTHNELVMYVGGAWFPHTDITGEAIGTGNGATKDFATDFPDVSAITIYVDGVEQTSGVTVDLNAPPTITDLSPYMRLVGCGGATGPKPTVGATNVTYAIGAYSTYYNPFYPYGIKTINVYRTGITLEVSDDLSTWTPITISSGVMNVPSELKTKKYWRITATASDSYAIGLLVPDTLTSVNNIHFDTILTEGAVITADYTTKTIAKDANHVFDLTVTLTLGEKTT